MVYIEEPEIPRADLNLNITSYMESFHLQLSPDVTISEDLILAPETQAQFNDPIEKEVDQNCIVMETPVANFDLGTEDLIKNVVTEVNIFFILISIY